jgi:hypothetical protein
MVTLAARLLPRFKAGWAYTPLGFAASRGYTVIVTILVKAGVDINYKSKEVNSLVV